MDLDDFQAEAELSMKALDKTLFKLGADIEECVDETTTAGKALHAAFVQMQTAFQNLTKAVKKLSDADIVEQEEEEEEEEEEET
jgi:hypothetical protein